MIERTGLDELKITLGKFEFRVDESFAGDVSIYDLEERETTTRTTAGFKCTVPMEVLLGFLGHYLAHESHAAFIERAATVKGAVDSKPQEFVEELVRSMTERMR